MQIIILRRSGGVITPFTLRTEMSSAYFIEVDIPIDLTKSEAGLMGSNALRG